MADVQPDQKPQSMPQGQPKKMKTNYLIPLLVVFFAIAAFLGVMYLGLPQ